MSLDAGTLLLAAIAIAFLWRLWGVLGTRNEDDPQQRNPFASPPSLGGPAQNGPANSRPTQGGDERLAIASTLLLPPGLPAASVAGGIQKVRSVDPAFDERAFLEVARDSFTRIVTAYAADDLSTVSDLLAPSLLAHFEAAAATRKAQGQSASTRVERIRDADIAGASVDGAREAVRVKVVSLQENVLRDAAGRVIGGTPGKIEEITDIWTFSRDTAVTDGKWIVVETGG
jgi:predicted lipid-binding transport protein (Tim44 family)